MTRRCSVMRSPCALHLISIVSVTNFALFPPLPFFCTGFDIARKDRLGHGISKHIGRVMEHQPQRKAQMDQFGTVGMILFAILLAFSQVVVRVTNEGIQPVFFAGIRSVGAAFLLLLWMRFRGIPLDFARAPLSGLWVALLFAGQFMFLFLALDYTTVARASVLFYTM